MIGISKEVTPEEITIIYQAFQAAVDVLIKEGTNREEASEIILNCSPFCENKNQIALIKAYGKT